MPWLIRTIRLGKSIFKEKSDKELVICVCSACSRPSVPFRPDWYQHRRSR